MWHKVRLWLGLRGYSHAHGHAREPHGHAHTHGAVDSVIATTARGIWAIQWSFVILAVTAALQLAIVLLSGSVALLADTIHNVGDAATAVPLWMAFLFARRRASARFTYGFGRVEDLAGVVVVLIILGSAVVAGYEAVYRLLHPQPLARLGWVAAAGVVGFLGNEWVAVFRIRVGREIDSAALVADGYHARIDGLTSLAVVLGAFAVWLGFPAVDPLIGLLITAIIVGIVWQSTQTVFTRLLDGVDPALVEDIRHAARHIPAVQEVTQVRARWLGHRLVIVQLMKTEVTLQLATSGHLRGAETERVHHTAQPHAPP